MIKKADKNMYGLVRKIFGADELKYPINEEELRKDITRVLNLLDPREAEVIRLSYDLGEEPVALSFAEIGRRYNLTRERIRQINEKAIRRLRHTERLKYLTKYVKPDL